MIISKNPLSSSNLLRLQHQVTENQHLELHILHCKERLRQRLLKEQIAQHRLKVPSRKQRLAVANIWHHLTNSFSTLSIGTGTILNLKLRLSCRDFVANGCQCLTTGGCPNQWVSGSNETGFHGWTNLKANLNALRFAIQCTDVAEVLNVSQDSSRIQETRRLGFLPRTFTKLWIAFRSISDFLDPASNLLQFTTLHWPKCLKLLPMEGWKISAVTSDSEPFFAQVCPADLGDDEFLGPRSWGMLGKMVSDPT